METEDVGEKTVGYINSGVRGPTGNKMDLLRQLVNENSNGIVLASSCRQLSNEVHGYSVPALFEDRKRVEEASREEPHSLVALAAWA